MVSEVEPVPATANDPVASNRVRTAAEFRRDPTRRGTDRWRLRGNATLAQPYRNSIGSRLSAPRLTSKCMRGSAGAAASDTTPIG